MTPRLALATFFVARVVAHERIAEPLRFRAARYEFTHQLVQCSRCIGPWAAAALLALDRTAIGRTTVDALALGGVNTAAQAAFAAVCACANYLEAEDE